MINRKQYFMVGGVLLTSLIVILYILFSISKPEQVDKAPQKEYRRIISMAPNITEILFALGLQNKLVGVTDFCTYPPDAKKIAKVGGYLNPNYEALLTLKPDLVILLPEQANVKQYIEELHISLLEVDNKKVEDIIQSISAIGYTCGARQKADSIVADLQQRIELVEKRVKGLPHSRVMISIGRTVGSGNLGEVYAAGKNTYYDELLNYAGAVNAVENQLVAYPALSAEGIIRINPDIIIDFVLDNVRNGLSDEQIKADWQSVQRVSAFKNNRYYIFNRGYAVIPGPRFILLLEDLANIIQTHN